MQVLPRSEWHEQRGISDQSSDMVKDFRLTWRDALSKNLDRPATRMGQSQQHADRGCLSSPIWTEKAEDLAFPDVERNVFNGSHGPEPLAEILSSQHHSVHLGSSIR